MIELNEKTVDYFAVDFQVSLHDIFYENFSNRRTDYHAKMRNNRERNTGILYDHYYKKLSIHNCVGNKLLTGNDLFCYPELCYELRKLKHYPYFSALIDLCDTMPKIGDKGLKAVKENIARLFEVLTPYQERKVHIDKQVNHLILLYGQKREAFSYQGAEKYDFSNELTTGVTGWRCYYKIKLSGVHYFNAIPESVKSYQPNEQLYIIDVPYLFRELVKNPKYEDLSGCIKSYEKIYADVIGGVMNTPILVFHVRKDYPHKGKRHYIDLFKGELASNLSDLKKMTREYVGNDFVLDIFHEHYQK